MFGRAAFIKVKPGCQTGLTRTFEQEVVPRLRSEKSFRGLIALVLPNEKEAFSISLWDQKENAQAGRAKSFGMPLALREWSWKIGWFKFGRSRTSQSASANK